MASCAACTATRSALLTSSCRAFNSRSISTTTGTTSSSAVSSSTIVQLRGPQRQPTPSSSSSSTSTCRALSTTCTTGIHLLPIATISPSLLTSTTTSNTGSAVTNKNNNEGLKNSFLLASTVAVLAACSLNFVTVTTTSSPSITTTTTPTSTPTVTNHATNSVSETTTEISGGSGNGGGDGSGGGAGAGGGPSIDAAVATVAVSSSSKKKSDDAVKAYEEATTKNPYQVSKSAEQGVRWTMEDTFMVANGGHFAAVFDGHGGSGVSGMLRDHVHRLYSKALSQRHLEETHKSALDEMQVDDDDGNDNHNDETDNKNTIPSIQSHVAAVRGALSRIERESLRHDHFEYQGSTAVAVIVHVGESGERTLVSANVGDSRAILCRGRKAIDLTRDHKPSDEREKARIRSMGEDVQWDPYGEIYRVKDLSLSRAIGDRFAKPVVSSEAEIDCLSVNDDEDEFFLLASDGLWDVMTSQEVVDFVHEMLECPTQSVKTKKGKIVLTPEFRRRKMARFIAHEALERGSADNVCVILVWLQKGKN